MTVTTRFNPSANGPLHLGHIYMAKVNMEYARRHGGTFIVRFDDSHPLYVERFGVDRIMRTVYNQVDDLTWLGIKPDEWILQSNLLEEVHDFIDDNGHHIPKFGDTNPTPTPMFISSGTPMYPYTPKLTLEKVVMDCMENVDTLIRGIDLLGEHSLYQYYCDCLGFQRPRHVYLPRLRWVHGDMSKTYGAVYVYDHKLRGYKPEDVWEMLSAACLANPGDGWLFENIKEQPSL